MIDITVSSNAKCKYVRSLQQKKGRSEHGEYTIEGIKSVRDAINSGTQVSAIYVSQSFYAHETFAYPENVPLYRVADGVFDGLCDTKAPQGILAVMKMGRDVFTPDITKAYIYCDSINDPGNLGTIIRTADAAGFGGVMLSPECVDLYNPKTVRSSMGSFFNMKVMRSATPDMLVSYKASGFSIYGGALTDESIDYRSADFTKPHIIVIGNEANGISDEVMKICTPVKIPILGSAESLNAGVAAAILMYEAVRQRDKKA